MFNAFIWRKRKLKIPVSVFVPLRSDLDFSATFSCPLVTRGHHSKQLYTFDLAEFYAKCPFFDTIPCLQLYYTKPVCLVVSKFLLHDQELGKLTWHTGTFQSSEGFYLQQRL